MSVFRVINYIPQERVFNEDEKTMILRLTDETLDRYNTIIYADGWMLENYLKNPAFQAYHITNGGYGVSPSEVSDYRIGASRKIFFEGKAMLSETFFEVDPEFENKLARKMWTKFKRGTMSAVSVGFDPMEWRWGLQERGEDEDILYFTKQDLLEHSAVDIPANPNATVNNFYAGNEEFLIKARALKATGVQDPSQIKNDHKGQIEWTRAIQLFHKKKFLHQ